MKTRSTTLFIILSLLLIILFVLDLLIGSVHIPLRDIFGTMLGAEVDPATRLIVLDIRLVKAIVAILTGIALSVSGLQMQTLFRNPLAGPSILGIDAGANLGVALVMLSLGGVMTLGSLNLGGYLLVTLAAMLGACCALVLLLFLSHRLKNQVMLLITGVVIGALGWEAGFIVAAVAGLIGSLIILLFVSDNPESKGLPSIQQLTGEIPAREDQLPTKELQKIVLKHPGIWIIALSSAFIYITKYAIAGWGVLFLQEQKGFSLTEATTIISVNALLGIFGTVLSGWFSDVVFKGDRNKPAFIFGVMNTISLILFLFGGNAAWINLLAMVLFGISIGVLICFLGGLMAVDIAGVDLALTTHGDGSGKALAAGGGAAIQ